MALLARIGLLITAIGADVKNLTSSIAAKVQNNLNASTTIAPSATAVNNALLLKQNLNPAIKVYNASSNTLVLADNGLVITMNHATAGSATTLTVPQNSSVAFPIGCSIPVVQLGTGQNTVVAGTGTTLIAPNGLKNRVQGSSLFLIKVALNTWVVGGDTAI